MPCPCHSSSTRQVKSEGKHLKASTKSHPFMLSPSYIDIDIRYPPSCCSISLSTNPSPMPPSHTDYS